jgi:hypothetical protein
MTTQPPDTERASQHVEKALECSCAALVTLESMRTRASEATNEIGLVQGQINELIGSLHAVLDDLRRARGEQSSGLARGFVR